FDGVFPSDMLPKTLEFYPSGIVVNTDPAHKPGSHWVAFHFDSSGHLDFFDSYGNPVTYYSPDLMRFADDNCISWSYNPHQLQGHDTNVCGHYCIAFLTMMARGYSPVEIVQHYRSPNRPGAHDEKVLDDTTRHYNIKNDGK